MAVAGEAEIEPELGQVVIAAEQVERAGKPEAQLVAIKRHAFHLAEDLGEIDGRHTGLVGNLRQCPASREVGGKQ
ncbi:hypothetical protein D3C87_1582330 [compost metagenome]